MPIYKQSAKGRQMTGGALIGEYIAHPVTCDITSDRLHFAITIYKYIFILFMRSKQNQTNRTKQFASENCNCAKLTPLYIFFGERFSFLLINRIY